MNTHRTGSGKRAAATALGRAVSVAVGAVALTLAASATQVAHAQSSSAMLKDVPIEALKRVYLSCGREAVGGRLDTSGIMYCSIVYEELKLRAFDGDFGKMLAWSKRHPATRDAEL